MTNITRMHPPNYMTTNIQGPEKDEDVKEFLLAFIKLFRKSDLYWMGQRGQRLTIEEAQPLHCKNQYTGGEERWHPGSRHRSRLKSRPNYIWDPAGSLKRSALPNGLIKVAIT
uniref:Uncharacterized protein n=1 Tax=Romanomermis culicivorax TaxID=13658 RepID=A0A915JV58_ROMCU